MSIVRTYIIFMKKLYKIYGYYQPQENKWYVGRTCRKYQSERAGKDGINYIQKCPKFAEDIQKYGWSSFEYHVLETTEDEELSWELKKKWVSLKDSFNNGYNSDTGGKNGRKLCKDSCEKISSIAQERCSNPEWRKDHSEKLKDFWEKEGSREKMAKANKGKTYPNRKGVSLSEETKKKMQESSPTKRPVYLYTNLGQFVAMYPSQREASRQTGIRQNTISAYLSRNPKRRYRNKYFVWSYEPPYTES